MTLKSLFHDVAQVNVIEIGWPCDQVEQLLQQGASKEAAIVKLTLILKIYLTNPKKGLFYSFKPRPTLNF